MARLSKIRMLEAELARVTEELGKERLARIAPPPSPPSPMRWGILPLGIGPEPFAVGERKTVRTRVQCELYEPTRLIVPKSIGRFYQIHDIKIGGRSQLVNDHAIPAAAFPEDAEDPIVNFTAAHGGTDLVLDVSCTHARRLLVVEYDLDTMLATRPAELREEVPKFSAIFMGRGTQS